MEAHNATGNDSLDALPLLRRFVSPYTGAVHHLHRALPNADIQGLRLVSCEVNEVTGVLAGKGPKPHGNGSGTTAEVAELRAIAEALERYAGSSFPTDPKPFASQAELGEQALDLSRLILYSEAQYADPLFPCRPVDENTRLRWTSGWSLTESREVLIPTRLAYLSDQAHPEEIKFELVASNGMAVHKSWENAVLNGLLELFERDAVMITWLAKLPPPLIDMDSDPELRELKTRTIMPSGMRWSLVDLSRFSGVPTVLGVLRSVSSDRVPFVIAAATEPTIQGACRKVVRELLLRRTWAQRLVSDNEPQSYDDLDTIEGFDDHVLFYLREKNIPAADLLDSSGTQLRADEIAPLAGNNPVQLIEDLLAKLSDLDIHAYVVDLTTPDLRTAGLHAVKVLAPGLQPIEPSHYVRHLDPRRLRQATARLGLSDWTEASINPMPHPFP